MQFVPILILQCYFLDILHEPDDKITGADKRVYNMHACIRQRPVELGFQEIFQTPIHHKVHNRLRGVDDTVRVCDFNGEPLEKLMSLDGVEKMLFFREILTMGSSVFNSRVKLLQRLQKLVAAHRMLHECFTDLFNLNRDDISVGKIRPVKNFKEYPFREDMLDEQSLQQQPVKDPG